MFEIVDRDMAVTVFVGEDSQRSLSERVANFCRASLRYTIIDTKDYPLKGNPSGISRLHFIRDARHRKPHLTCTSNG